MVVDGVGVLRGYVSTLRALRVCVVYAELHCRHIGHYL